MAFAQIAVTACFILPILLFLALAVHALVTAVRNEMAAPDLPAADGNVSKVIGGLVSLLITAGLIAICAGTVRWLA